MSKSPRRVRPHYLGELGSKVDTVIELIVHDLVVTGAMAVADAEVLTVSRAVDYLGGRAYSDNDPTQRRKQRSG